MADDNNKRNVQYFEAPSMRELHKSLTQWQAENQKRFLSFSIQHDQGVFCCIALTNPTEVVITNEGGSYYADVLKDGSLKVFDTRFNGY